jgi:hypothetical protein
MQNPLKFTIGGAVLGGSLAGGAGTASAVDYYVDASVASSGDGLSWATAKQTIQAGVDAASAGDTVWITNGTYSISSQLEITKNITVQSVNGPDVTVVDGGGVCRCAYLTAGTLSGITLTNGFISGSGAAMYTSGGGAYLFLGGTLTNCIISGCSAINGGGVWLYNGTLCDCTLSGNAADNGAGAYLYGGDISNCTLCVNVATSHGGGAYLYSGEINTCRFFSNSANYGGGAQLSGGTMNNSTLSGNTANNGGGVHLTAGEVDNCMLHLNSAISAAGGAYLTGGELNNCTLSGNSAGYGGGVYLYSDGTLNNSIVWGNKATSLWNDLYKSEGTGDTVCNTCSPDGVTNGVSGCITADPQFVSTNDFRLLAGSPCIDAGDDGHASGSMDLLGNHRLIDGDFDAVATVDMGACEYNPETIDSDSDSFSDDDEYVAGTCATNGADYFCINALSNNAVWFNTAADRAYTLYGCSNLTDAVWCEVGSAEASVDGAGSIAITNAAASIQFYKLEVSLPE